MSGKPILIANPTAPDSAYNVWRAKDPEWVARDRALRLSNALALVSGEGLTPTQTRDFLGAQAMRAFNLPEALDALEANPVWPWLLLEDPALSALMTKARAVAERERAEPGEWSATYQGASEP